MKIYKCRFCENEFVFEKQASFASHCGNCKSNPTVLNNVRGLKSKQRSMLLNPVSEYNLSCKKCNKEYTLNLKLNAYNKDSFTKFCSRACANSRGPRSEEVKRKISNGASCSEKLKAASDKRRLKPKKISCIICKEDFYHTQKRKVCSKFCKNELSSINRQRIILEKGTNNFKTKQESFSYKFVKDISTDSKLEQAAIIYLIDILNVEKVEKYRNILNFKDGEATRTFNPDFYVVKEEQVFIVEVKMKWIATSSHNYNRTIPLKKQALGDYCKEKGYEMIWLDFDYDESFRKIYTNLLHNKQIKT